MEATSILETVNMFNGRSHNQVEPSGMTSKKMCTVGDFNAHNSDWIHLVSDTDKAGERMEEFVQLNGMLQLVDFSTREGNTLDLIMTDFEDTATVASRMGRVTTCPSSSRFKF